MSPELTANRTLTADDVRNEAVELLEGLVDESVGGYRVNRAMLLDAILYAAAEGTSLHGACGMLDGLADDTTLRDHLNAAFPASSAFELNRRAKSVLLASAPKAVFKRKQEIAIDSKDFPYCGQHPGLEPWICRGQARAGTTRFLRIATAYVMRQGQRVTLAAIQVSKGMTLEMVANPDQEVRLWPEACSGCGQWLEAGDGEVNARGQIFDLPPIRLLVTEYQTMACIYPVCGTRNQSQMPERRGGRYAVRQPDEGRDGLPE